MPILLLALCNWKCPSRPPYGNNVNLYALPSIKNKGRFNVMYEGGDTESQSVNHCDPWEMKATFHSRFSL